jgi:shikimate dehydrogenase
VAVAYLVGDPVAHSLSPAMQNAAFAALGLPHRYELMRVSADGLAVAVERIRRDDVLGANVTIPHKERVGRSLDAVEETAQRIGAVNTLFKRAGTLRGDNTDGPGFADALAEKGVEVRGRSVLLLGAGGAARACLDHLARAGAEVSVANRSGERARELAARVVAWPVRSLDGYEIVVNATALGLDGEDALDGVVLWPELVVVDVVATVRETPLVARARASGCIAVDGLIMLLHQGARAFRLWTGVDAPVNAMRAALPRAV